MAKDNTKNTTEETRKRGDIFSTLLLPRIFIIIAISPTGKHWSAKWAPSWDTML